MVDLEVLTETPFGEASNRSFGAILLVGVALLAAVAVVGRSPVTVAATTLYLLCIPVYVAVRVRRWEGTDEEPDDGEPGGEETD